MGAFGEVGEVETGVFSEFRADRTAVFFEVARAGYPLQGGHVYQALHNRVYSSWCWDCRMWLQVEMSSVKLY